MHKFGNAVSVIKFCVNIRNVLCFGFQRFVFCSVDAFDEAKHIIYISQVMEVLDAHRSLKTVLQR